MNVMQLAWQSPPDTGNHPSPAFDVGNLIRSSENRYPHYHVIAVREDRVWIRDLRYGTDQILPVAAKNGLLLP